MLEEVKRHCWELDVSGYVKEKREGGDLMGLGMEFLDGVGWMGFAEKGGGELGVRQAYPDQGAEEAASVASIGDRTCTPGRVGRKEDTGRRSQVNISHLLRAVTGNAVLT